MWAVETSHWVAHCPKSCPSIPWVTCTLMVLPGLYWPWSLTAVQWVGAQSRLFTPWKPCSGQKWKEGLNSQDLEGGESRLWLILSAPWARAGVFLMPHSYPFLPWLLSFYILFISWVMGVDHTDIKSYNLSPSSFFPSQQETHCFSDYFLLTVSPASFSQQEAPIFLSPFHVCQELKITVPTYWEYRTMVWSRLFVFSLCLWQSFCQEMPTLSCYLLDAADSLQGLCPSPWATTLRFKTRFIKSSLSSLNWELSRVLSSFFMVKLLHLPQYHLWALSKLNALGF